jgi:hypothetical protein
LSETVEQAQEAIHEAHEAHHQGNPVGRRIAVLIAILAALLAVSEMGEKGAQNAYLTRHVTVMDDWAFYQAKNVRAAVLTAEVAILKNLPNNADPGPQADIKQALAAEARLRDDPQGGEGMKQIVIRAKAEEAARDVVFHRYHEYEIVVGALQIAIVLASVSVVTNIMALAFGAGAIGILAGVYGFLVTTIL